jgi:hypothetical protein
MMSQNLLILDGSSFVTSPRNQPICTIQLSLASELKL